MRILAPRTSRYSITRLLSVLEKRGVDPATLDLSLFSFMTGDLGWLRRRLDAPGYKVAGGPHPSGDPDGTKGLGFDLVVVGEGESVLERIIAGERPEGIIKGEPLPLELYPPFSFRFQRFGPIELIRGCPHRCAFCQTPRIFGPVRRRDPDDVCYWMRKLVEVGIGDIRFIAPDGLAYGIEDLKKIFEARPEGARIFFGSFPSELRPESVTESGIELIRRFCSNRRVIIGGQAGSDELLRRIDRGHGVAAIFKAVRIITRSGLIPIVDMIFGLPGEREFEAETIRFLEDITREGAIIHAHYFTPLPGTDLAHARPEDTSYLNPICGRLAREGKLFGSWH
ncbi:TIGR04013 family B12-binding domain/radical SAM domain-containing protein [candidate division WOR-3 bacterium]|uniref:TIGR04013 family B12-binding domain/radical SAM domain-containing protein n=1 Tax=candidate division WOR-3 bacterium TaxID=2052148 RepID=A0A660SG80_UNCW3|nr:MAG: TIGR04013 family B12-binding domain/radical SAM domain-containing protein [candidate division WOR-3 bacterium]